MSKHVVAALSSALFTLAWWKAAVLRGARTAVVIVVPYVGGVVLFKDVDWLTIVSAAGLGFAASLITSLAGIPEAGGNTVPVWLALLERTTKTVAQGIAVGIGNAVLFSDVHWSTILQAALISGLGSLLLGVLGFLPEAAEPAIVTRTPDGSYNVTNVNVTNGPDPAVSATASLARSRDAS
jgi:hypothetical protein